MGCSAPDTPSAARRSLLLHIAAVDEREARARMSRHPAFASWLLDCAARSRAEALALTAPLSPPEQLSLF